MITLDVTITGERRTYAPDGITVIGGVTGTFTAQVGWNGDWLTDGDPAELDSQRNEVVALFPQYVIREITITPEPTGE
jgi:hypothetical protein